MDGGIGLGRAELRVLEGVQLGAGLPPVGASADLGGVATEVPQRIVPLRRSYRRPGGPRRETSRRTISVLGTDHDSAAASPGIEVVPKDLSVAIACCRSSGAGRDQKGSRTKRGGRGMG
ncbi:MAG: hypothetical protein L3J97_00470 [Thermoplasmata archaeon]|nr:hypothetical protein [Thermoplasmata archaeon]